MYSYIVWTHFSHSSLQIEKEQELHLKLHLRHVDTRWLLLILPAYHKGNKNVVIIQGVSKRISQFQTSLIPQPFMIKTRTVRKWGFVSLTWLSVGSITTAVVAVTPDLLEKYGMILIIAETYTRYLETPWTLVNRFACKTLYLVMCEVFMSITFDLFLIFFDIPYIVLNWFNIITAFPVAVSVYASLISGHIRSTSYIHREWSYIVQARTLIGYFYYFSLHYYDSYYLDSIAVNTITAFESY